MEKRTLLFALLLLFIRCFCSEVTTKKNLREQTGFNETVAKVTVLKTIGRKTDTTPVCTNDTLNVITFITCKIRTERGEDCRLGYRYGLGFEDDCGSKFRLMTENGTVFLQLMNLTQEDSGHYSCECTRSDGTYSVDLNVTVEDGSRPNGNNSSGQIPFFHLLGPAITIIITGLVIGVVYRRMRNRKPPELLNSSPPNTEPGDIEPYNTFIQRETGLYSTVQLHEPNANSKNSVVSYQNL